MIRLTATLRNALLPVLGLAVLFLWMHPPAYGKKPQAPAAPRPLRVVIPEDAPPTYYRDRESQKAAGFAIGLTEYVALAETLQIEYVFADNWETIIQMLVDGRADFSPNVGIDAPREQVLDFSTIVEVFPISMFIRNGSSWGQPAGTRLKIGALRSSISYGVIRTNPAYDILAYDTYSQGLLDLLAGHIDGFASPEPTLKRLALDLGIDDKIQVVPPPIAEIRRAFAVRKGNTALLAKLDRALVNFIGTPRYEQLYVQWYGKPAPYWTVTKVLVVSGGFLCLVIIVMSFWRYRSLKSTLSTLRRTEAELHQSEENYRTLVETAEDAIVLTDLQGNHVFRNSAYATSLGYDVDSDVPQNGFANVHPDDIAMLKDRMQELPRSGVLSAEYRVRHRNGHWVHRSNKAKLLYGRDGKPDKILSIIRDNTEQKRMEEALKLSELQFRTAFENTLVGMVFTSPDGRLMRINAAFAKMLGYGIDELQGEDFSSITYPDDRAANSEQMRALLAGQQHTSQFVKRYLHKDGRIVWTDVGVSLIRTADGTPLHFVVYVSNISERVHAEETLQETNEKLRALVLSSPITVIALDCDRLITLWNPAAEQTFGWKSDEVLGKQLPFIVDQDREEYLRLTKRVLDGEIVSNFETYRSRKDGVRIAVSISIAPLRDRHGLIAGLISVTDDITARRNVEEALRMSEERLRKAQAQAHVGNWEIDLKTRTIVASEEAYRIYGFSFTSGKIPLTEVQNLVVPEDRPVLDTALRDLITIRKDYNQEFHIRRLNDNALRVIHSQAELVCDEANQPVAIRGVLQDITERTRAETALRESEERYRLLYESSPIGIYRTTPAGEIIMANPSLVKMLGFDSFEELAARNLESTGFEPQYDREWFKQEMGRRGIVEGLEATWLRKDGSSIHVRENVRLIRDAGGSPLYYDGTAEDITEQKRLQVQLFQSQKMEAIGQLAGGVAHDFNNMVGVILGYADMLTHELPETSPLQKSVQAILAAAERSANLTKQLLAFARKQIIAPVPVNLNEEMSALQKMLSRLIGEDITLLLKQYPGLWTCKIDLTQLIQIMTNLATNARDAIEDTGAIAIETGNVTIDAVPDDHTGDIQAGEYVMLSISDTGKGMDKRTLSLMFEPFFTTKPKGKGTGLGLSTVFGIVKQNNGFINVYSEPGHGTTFKIYFPRYYGKAEHPTPSREELPLKGTETILVVEDEEELLRLTVRSLEQYGYHVHAAQSPAEALSLCERGGCSIDLLLTDVVMPGMNGKELRERIQPLQPRMKVLFMSGYTADIVAHRGILDEDTHFLQKPFLPVMLVRKVREVLNLP